MTPKRRCPVPSQTLGPIRKSPFAYVRDRVLCLFVALVADQDEGERGGPIGLSLLQPFGDVKETVSVADVVDYDGSDGVAIVAPRDGFEALLACLGS